MMDRGQKIISILPWFLGLFLLLSLSAPWLPGFCHAGEREVPFSEGERLKFLVNWSHIIAGELTLEVMPMAKAKGLTCRHFAMTGKTSKFIDIFYKVRDRIDAYTDVGVTHSIFYTKKRRGSKKKNEKIDFDWKRQVAIYTKNGRRRQTVKLMPGTFDPLSVFYVFRLHRMAVGQTIRVPVSDGKKCVMGEAKVIRRETIQIANMPYDCFLVIPDLKHIGGAFEHGKGSKMKMWFTSDQRHIPVKVQAKVKVGTFTLELKGGQGGSAYRKASLAGGIPGQ